MPPEWPPRSRLGLASRDALATLAAPRARRPSISDTALGATRPSIDPALEPTGASIPVTAPTVASGVAVAPTAPTAPAVPEQRHGTATGAELIERAPAPSSTSRYLAFGVAGAVAIAGGWWLAHRPATHDAAALAPSTAKSKPAVESGQTSVLIPLANQTPDPMLDATLDVVLASALYRSPLVQPYADATLRALSSELGADGSQASIARLLHARGGRVVVLHGAIKSKGRGYAIAITATDTATGAVVLERAIDVASAHELVPAIGTLAGALVHALGGPDDTAGVTGMSDQLEADHEFVVAKALASAGNYQDTATHAGHAVALDANFAQPHALLGIVDWNLGRLGDADRELKLALR